jgi:two-component system, cell cycle sensor histidine kinase and response regulator CckA
VVITALHDDAGGVIGFGKLTRDWSDRKRAIDALEQSESRLRHVVEASPTGILLVDDSGSIVLVNQSVEAMFGYDRSELLGRPVELLVPASSRPDHAAQRAAFSGDGRAHRMGVGRELLGLRRDGSTVPLEIGLSHFDLTQGPVILATLTDATERRALEGRLNQAAKMEAIGRLAGGIAHDFNNLLGVITGYGELAKRGLPLDHPIQARLDQMMKAAGRAADLTRQMLAFSRKQVLHSRPLNLNVLIEDTRPILARLIGEDVEIVVRLAADLGTVMGDPTQIDQVLMNLAVNARDAMPKGGTLTIETGNVELDLEYVRRHVAGVPGAYVMLAVSDTGTGMDETTRSHIFEPFFTTKAEGEGTGLGLATVYGIVKQSGGFVWVYSEPDCGATFKIYLPRVKGAAQNEGAPVPPEAVAAGTETVLVVEDQDPLRDMIAEILTAEGYTVLSAPDGASALDLAEAHDGTIDLLLSDVVMPGIGGRALVESLTALRPGLRALYMSGYTNGAISDRGLLPDGVVLIEKPFTGSQLAAAVRKALDASRP